MTINPRAAAVLAECPDLEIASASMVDHGRYYRRHRVAFVRSGATIAEWADWAVHEALHHLRGDGKPANAWWEAKQEAAVRDAAARALVDLSDLADALAGALNIGEVADELQVTAETVLHRLEHLTIAEEAWLTCRPQVEEGAG